jgi:hypothetical protein
MAGLLLLLFPPGAILAFEAAIAFFRFVCRTTCQMCQRSSITSSFLMQVKVHGYEADASEFTDTYGACGVTGTTGVLVSASVPFKPLLSPKSELPLESHLSITLTGQSTAQNAFPFPR